MDDLHRFMVALDGGALLPAQLRERMATPVRGDYGLGLQILDAYGHRMVNHTGEIGGFAANVAYYADERLFVAVLSNVELEPVKATACDLAAIVLGSPTALDQHLSATADTSWFDLVTGAYLGADEVPRRVTRQGNKFSLEREGSSARTLIPVGVRMFSVEGAPGLMVSFEGPAGKRATGFTARVCGGVLLTGQRSRQKK